MSLHQRIAIALGWPLEEVLSVSLRSLRELLPEGKLRAEVTDRINRDAHIKVLDE